ALNQRSKSRYDLGGAPSRSLPSEVLGHARLTDLNAGRTYPLTKPLVVIGREDGCDIKLVDANVSRKHAQLTQDVTGTWKVTDLGSTNGSKLNGSPVTKALLCDGDVIIIGITTLEFRES
ncbi:MAG TPA: DUF2662 domain-containing protein, partial [Coriobacteriia bacterium]|nr:DUF2662 domain-containing protein [Coriobacteriia bacterium]